MRSLQVSIFEEELGTKLAPCGPNVDSRVAGGSVAKPNIPLHGSNR